jgi:hypothetical protein
VRHHGKRVPEDESPGFTVRSAVPEPPRLLTPEKWAKLDREPTDKNRALEAAFLDEHAHYGGRIHEETAAALVAGLGGRSGIATGHGLYLRLFAEYATALETLGAWGWTFRNRGEYRLFLDALLAYPLRSPAELFEAARRARTARGLLRLPEERRLLPAMRETFEGWSDEECRRELAKCLVVLKRAAATYLTDDRVIASTYNKAKHGATMFRPPELEDEREFYVLAPHLRPSGPKDSRYSPRKFRVDKTMIGTVATNVATVGAGIRFLAGSPARCSGQASSSPTAGAERVQELDELVQGAARLEASERPHGPRQTAPRVSPLAGSAAALYLEVVAVAAARLGLHDVRPAFRLRGRFARRRRLGRLRLRLACRVVVGHGLDARGRG